MQRVLESVVKWRKNIAGRYILRLKAVFHETFKVMENKKLDLHDKLRKHIMFVTFLSILLVHFSKALKKDEFISLF